MYNRWHSIALIIGTRAAGGTQNLQPDTITGTHAMKSAPSNLDWMERRELTGGMLRWLVDMHPIDAAPPEQMHEAIVRANGRQLERLMSSIERAEWLLKVTWEFEKHRKLKASESDRNGKESLERSIVMSYRGVHSREAADELKMSLGQIRWLRRKHGLSIYGERMYPCTVALGENCVACGSLNEYGDDYETQEAA